jgi:hypothetical protein
MIEGLKVTIKAPELQALALKRAEHYAEKSAALRKQLPTLDELDVPNSSNRPGEDARKKIENYESQAAELLPATAPTPAPNSPPRTAPSVLLCLPAIAAPVAAPSTAPNRLPPVVRLTVERWHGS